MTPALAYDRLDSLMGPMPVYLNGVLLSPGIFYADAEAAPIIWARGALSRHVPVEDKLVINYRVRFDEQAPALREAIENGDVDLIVMDSVSEDA